MRVENKPHIVIFLVDYNDYNEVYACYPVKIFKNETLKKIKRGCAPGAALLDSPLTQVFTRKGPFDSQKGDKNFSML